MAGLGKSLGGLTATLMNGRNPKLPPLPADLGLPAKSTGIATYNEKRGNMASESQYKAALQQANTYNQSLVQLLNQQPQLSGAERTELYRYYGDDMPNAQIPVYNQYKKKFGGITDFTGQLSQMTPEQFQAQQAAQQQQAQQQAQPVQAPVQQQQQTPPPAQPAPQTVGPVAKPPVEQPPTTPSVSTPEGNVAGKTTTTGGSEGAVGGTRPRRGRFATLLTGLGGALERFGS